jgi:glycosyltransferase involved in cell wall biosynthesis
MAVCAKYEICDNDFFRHLTMPCGLESCQAEPPLVPHRRVFVQFLGPTEHAQTIQLLKTAHAFASWVTGPYPALGTAPMEAMLCETPVVNDQPENLFSEGKLKNGENIVLVNSRDLQSIAAALVRLLQDSACRQHIGSGGRRFVLEQLNWNTIAGQMEVFYRRVLREKGRNV